MSKTYHATYERDHDAWVVELAEEPRCHTWGRTLSQARQYIEEAARLWFPNEDFELVDDVRLSPRAQEQLAQLRSLYDMLKHTTGMLREAQHRAARALTEEAGLSMRDAGHVLGVSHQRVAQLLNERVEAAQRKGARRK